MAIVEEGEIRRVHMYHVTPSSAIINTWLAPAKLPVQNVLNVIACPIDSYENGESYQVNTNRLCKTLYLDMEDYKPAPTKNVQYQKTDCFIYDEADQQARNVQEKDERANRQEETHQADN